MGNLINPLSRILGYKKNLFWGNNFSFYYFQDVYRQKIFKIRCFQKMFKYTFRLLFRAFDFPRVYYNLNLNFVGQSNSILNIKCNVRNLNLYNIATALMLFNSIKTPEVAPTFRDRLGHYRLRSRLQVALKYVKARFERIFIKWRNIILDLFLQKLKKKLETRKFSLINDVGNLKRKYGKMVRVFRYCQHFKIKTQRKIYLRRYLSLDTLKIYFKTKFKLMSITLNLLRSFTHKFFVETILIFFRSCFNKIIYNFGIRRIKFYFRRKKINTSSILRDVNHYCYLALRKGYRINYIIKVVRNSVRFLKSVRGFQMIVSGRFYRRGRAMFKISTLGEMGSHSGKGFLMYRNSERMKEYGMCSIKLLFFFRRKLNLFKKLPIRCRWFHYIKYLRANYKLRSQFGHIRY